MFPEPGLFCLWIGNDLGSTLVDTLNERRSRLLRFSSGIEYARLSPGLIDLGFDRRAPKPMPVQAFAVRSGEKYPQWDHSTKVRPPLLDLIRRTSPLRDRVVSRAAPVRLSIFTGPG